MTITRALFDLIVAGVATAGFALLFRTQTRSLLPGALIGGIGYILYDWITLATGSAPVAAFFAGLFIGTAAECAARVLKGPTIVFATMGIIPPVPGYGLYRTMELIVLQDYTSAIAKGCETLMIAGAIALSLGFSAVVARSVLQKKQEKRKAQ